MFSKSCKYAIRAVIYIARKDEKLSVHQIATAIDAPFHFIAKILQDLSRNKIINSTKGPNGGFSITEKQMNASIMNIVKAIDGDNIFKDCGLGLANCDASRPCPMHKEFSKIRRQLKSFLSKATLINFSNQGSNDFFLNRYI